DTNAQPGGTSAAAARPNVNSRRVDGTRPTLHEQAWIVGDHAGDAEALEPADVRGVVDRPDVELAALLAYRPHERRGDEPVMRHDRVAAARREMGARGADDAPPQVE